VRAQRCEEVFRALGANTEGVLKVWTTP
jgi:hypothetical protein